MKINPYLNFPGTAEEAFNFYKTVFGGEFSMVQRFKNMPGVDNCRGILGFLFRFIHRQIRYKMDD